MTPNTRRIVLALVFVSLMLVSSQCERNVENLPDIQDQDASSADNQVDDSQQDISSDDNQNDRSDQDASSDDDQNDEGEQEVSVDDFLNDVRDFNTDEVLPDRGYIDLLNGTIINDGTQFIASLQFNVDNLQEAWTSHEWAEAGIKGADPTDQEAIDAFFDPFTGAWAISCWYQQSVDGFVCVMDTIENGDRVETSFNIEAYSEGNTLFIPMPLGFPGFGDLIGFHGQDYDANDYILPLPFPLNF